MDTTSREKLTRHPDGYTTADGYLLERCPANQWNVVTHPGGAYPDDYVAEGARNMTEALKVIEKDRADRA